MGESTVTGAGVLTGSIAVNCGWAVGGGTAAGHFPGQPENGKNRQRGDLDFRLIP